MAYKLINRKLNMFNTENSTIDTDYDILQAAVLGDYRTVKRHISNPWYNINKTNNDGNNALLLACIFGHLHIIKVLLNTPGFNKHAQDNYKRDPLKLAVTHGRHRAVKVLLKNGFSDKNNHGIDSALMIACYFGDIDIIDTLLETEASFVNYKNKNGQTALSITVISKINTERTIEIIMRLLKAGANPFSITEKFNIGSKILIRLKLINESKFDIIKEITPLPYDVTRMIVDY
jgi:ankyrin repeat protein